jgi:predicted site-specific integrase-resolvase
MPTPRPAEHRLLTDREAPDVVGVKRKTLQEWRRLGKGPEFVRVSNRIFYRYGDLLAFLAACPHSVGKRSHL